MFMNSPVTTRGEQKTAQLRVKHPAPGRGMVISAYGTSGTIFWETPSRAKFLIDAGGFELVNVKPVGPSTTKPAGPGEMKDGAEKKPSPAAPDGHSIASVPSSAPGPAEPASFSAAGQVSAESNAQASPRRGRPPKSG